MAMSFKSLVLTIALAAFLAVHLVTLVKLHASHPAQVPSAFMLGAD